MTPDQLPAGLPMDDKIEAWHREAKRLLSLAMTQARANGDNVIAAGDAVMAHLRTTPEGFVLVPVEPTPKMSAAGFCVSEADHDPAGVYRAMLAASQESGT